MEKLRILFIALYSEKYPSIGESHGVSVVAGAVLNKCANLPIEYFEVIDMVALSDKGTEYIIEKIKFNKPNIIGFSVNYGTYDTLKEIIDGIRRYLDRQKPFILLGGPIVTYIPEIVFNKIYNEAFIVIGEGDEATPMAITAWFYKKPFELIPNLCYKIGDEIFFTIRRLVKAERVSLPYRGHIEEVFKNKAQVYIESSRGCSWAACTFCLRGLTDLKGKRTEYRRFSIDRLTEDLSILKKHSIRVFTFADEDFLGGDLEENEAFINKFQEFCLLNELDLSFDASLTVHSIFSHRHTIAELNKIQLQLKKLKSIGLRKIFLGIESGCDSQLKRFVKGHSSLESLSAIEIVRSLGLELELGFIMFDPLCSLNEIEENVDFLYKNDLTRYVSFLSNELRLQIDTSYIKVLEIQENKNKRILYDRNLDLNTISHSYKYLNQDVSTLVDTIKFWNNRIRNIHYPLKSLSRYGEGGILGEFRDGVVQIIINLRNEYLQLIKREIDRIKRRKNKLTDNSDIDVLLYDCSLKIIELFKKIPNEILDNQILQKVLKTCDLEIESFQSKYIGSGL